MKKLLFASCLMLAMALTTTAQTPATKAAPVKQAPIKAVPPPAKVVKMEKAPATATTAKPVAKAKPATVTGTPVKADGSPDMRYKQNKGAAAPVAGPKKADGTADMRYKANKPAAKAKN